MIAHRKLSGKMLGSAPDQATLVSGRRLSEKTVTAVGISVKILGQSGKMTMTMQSRTNTTQVECQMSALRQLDASGAILGGGGQEKHSFNSFATQAFTFSDPVNTTYQNLSVAKVTFDSVLAGSSKVKIDTFIFQESGKLTMGNQTTQVPQGAVKFNVELSNWSWCGGGNNCTAADGEGASVELDLFMAAKGRGSPTKTSGHNNDFDLGDGSKLFMFDTYSLDGGSSWVKMPAGYPKVNGSIFTLKFPRWAGTVLYDPIVVMEESVSTSSTTASTTTAPGATSTSRSTIAEGDATSSAAATTSSPIIGTTTRPSTSTAAPKTAAGTTKAVVVNTIIQGKIVAAVKLPEGMSKQQFMDNPKVKEGYKAGIATKLGVSKDLVTDITITEAAAGGRRLNQETANFQVTYTITVSPESSVKPTSLKAAIDTAAATPGAWSNDLTRAVNNATQMTFEVTVQSLDAPVMTTQPVPVATTTKTNQKGAGAASSASKAVTTSLVAMLAVYAKAMY